MWNDLTLSRVEIARRLQISDLSVTNIAHRLNFPMNTPGARVSNDKAHRRTSRKTLSESRELNRQKWLKVLKENPKANRDKLIKLANFEYLWLMRNDAEWMEKRLPEVIKVARKKELLDWKKIDRMLSPIVKKACEDIYSELFPKRVCITEIIKRVRAEKMD